MEYAWGQLSESLGWEVSDSALQKLAKLEELLLRWQPKHNLFSPNDLPILRTRHFLDALMPTVWQECRQAKSWIDMGSGTGFPLLPLAIVMPDCQFVGVEPRSKRVLMLRQMAREVGLSNVKIFEGRAEDYQESQAECVSARAVGSFEEDWIRAEPLLVPQGRFVTFKTDATCPAATDEICYLEYRLPGSHQEYRLVQRLHHG